MILFLLHLGSKVEPRHQQRGNKILCYFTYHQPQNYAVSPCFQNLVSKTSNKINKLLQGHSRKKMPKPAISRSNYAVKHHCLAMPIPRKSLTLQIKKLWVNSSRHLTVPVASLKSSAISPWLSG